MQTERIPESSLSADKTPADGQLVVLIHGLGPGRLPMWPLTWRLKRAGYRTLNWHYPCLRHTIEEHGRRLHATLESLDADRVINRLHLVTYSMGSIVGRVALGLGRPSKLGRMVMLAPPNRGSRWASRFGPVLRCCVRTVDQLAARPDSFVNSLAEPQGLEIGIIAARHDQLVGADSSQLAAAQDRVVLPGLHSFLPIRRDAARQVRHFFAHGAFDHGVGDFSRCDDSTATPVSAPNAKQP